MKLSFPLSVVVLLFGAIFFWVFPQHQLEPFTQKMRPWFGYEPGYGPGWGRTPCCGQAVPQNMGNM